MTKLSLAAVLMGVAPAAVVAQDPWQALDTFRQSLRAQSPFAVFPRHISARFMLQTVFEFAGI